ncbi:MAG: hypothetical protein AAF337_04870, partial [Pseudomonadota bacterium]
PLLLQPLLLNVTGWNTRKVPTVGASRNREDMMRLITQFELSSKTDADLHALYRSAFNALARSTPNSAMRRNALASLENISRERCMRLR